MSSYRAEKPYVALYLKSHFPKGSSCLDVGCCEGIWFDFLSDHFHMDGVEVWTPNVYTYHLYERYENVYCKNIVDFTYNKNYDVIVFGDILEHLSVEEAQQVLLSARAHAKEVVVAIPYNYPQDDKDGNIFEIHKQPDLTREVFLERYPGFKVLTEWGNLYGYYILDSNGVSEEKMLKYSLDNIYALTSRGVTNCSTKEQLDLMLHCCNIVNLVFKFNLDSQSIYRVIYPYMEHLRLSVLLGEIPNVKLFWKQLSKIDEVFQPNRLLATLQNWLSTKSYDDSKWLFDIESIYEDAALANDYMTCAITAYSMQNKLKAKEWNDKALELDPNNQYALANKVFYE